MNTIKHIYEIIAPYFAGGIVGIIVSVIIIPFIKGKITKASSGINSLLEKHDKVVIDSTNEAVNRIKEVSFKQSIQPLVESELAKVGEAANAQIENSVKELTESNARVIGVLEALGAYFDDSIISDEKKSAFHAALDEAKNASVTEVPTEAVIIPVEEKKTVKKGGGITR